MDKTGDNLPATHSLHPCRNRVYSGQWSTALWHSTHVHIDACHAAL